MSDELSTALREFAAEHESPPVLSGAEVRRRAVRRTRRRLAGTLAAGAAALALVGFTLTLTLDSTANGKRHQPPAAPAPAPPPPAAPSSPAPSPALSAVPSSPAAPTAAVPVAGTIDRGRRTLTVGDRVMPMASGFDKSPAFNGPLTVYKKHADKTLTVTNGSDGLRYNAEIVYAVELRDAENQPVYVGTNLSYNTEGIGKYEAASGWIALDEADAKWFYGDARTGSVFSVTGTTF